ncbi:UNVERIFIED_CONTAM: hypothetical protein Slati_2916100 [Sesamum latifolium]|uniref:Uncharacterized protein n=1 Tax=Sesamum latifolium TaxID=2727402 RepID=A0AAW2VE67_9LAMI
MINARIEVVSGDTPTQDHGETLPSPSINASDDPSKAGAIVVADDVEPRDPKKRK